MSLNTAQIIDYGRNNYGLNVSNDQAQAIMNNSGGGDPSKIDSAFQSLPQVQQAQMLSNAKALQNFYVQANQPSIQTLQTQYNPATGSGALTDKYNALLSSIKQQGSVAANQTTLATAGELAKRGILPESSLYQSTLGSALLPVTAQYAGITAQTGLGEQQDLQTVINNIAQLQAGNPSVAISAGQNLSGLQLQANQLPYAIALQQAQAQQAAAQAQEAQTAAKYVPLVAGGNLYNTSSQNIVSPALQLLQQLGINVIGQ